MWPIIDQGIYTHHIGIIRHEVIPNKSPNFPNFNLCLLRSSETLHRQKGPDQ